MIGNHNLLQPCFFFDFFINHYMISQLLSDILTYNWPLKAMKIPLKLSKGRDWWFFFFVCVKNVIYCIAIGKAKYMTGVWKLCIWSEDSAMRKLTALSPWEKCNVIKHEWYIGLVSLLPSSLALLELEIETKCLCSK